MDPISKGREQHWMNWEVWKGKKKTLKPNTDSELEFSDVENTVSNVTFIECFIHFLHLGSCLKNPCPYFQ